MFVIEVIPLIRGTKIDTLSYYSGTDYAVGTFLDVMIRNKRQRAVVTATYAVAESKTELRNAAFTLQKLLPQSQISSVPEHIKETAQKLTKIYPFGVGAILFQLLPPEVRDGRYQYPKISTLIQTEESTPKVLTAKKSDRFIIYRSHIRSILARRGSVMFVTPTSADVAMAKMQLAQGIEDRIVIFSPNQTPKERLAAFAAFEDTSLAKVIIATPSHAYLDRVDLLSIIVENEASDFYRGRVRPYLDHRTALIVHAKTTGRSILLGDILPRPEIELKRRTELYSTESEETKRLSFTSLLTIVEQKEKPTADNPFSLFSKELTQRITATINSRGRVFLFGARRGLSPVVTCIDCGYIFRCGDSGSPFSLLRTNKDGKEERWFVSSTSGKRLRAEDTCPNCSSWRLRERGIGIQSVYDDCLLAFPKQKILLFDHLTANTSKRALGIISNFYADRGTILIGTSMALPYLANQGVDLSAVISLDATRANPTWHTDENVLRLILELREFSHKEVLIQTRSATDDLLRCANSGQIESFYTEELSLREVLKYPPYATFILLSWQGDTVAVEKIETEVKKRTAKFTGNFYSNPLSNDSKTLRHALFRIPGEEPAYVELIEIVRTFPPYIKIEIDPNRIV